MQYQEFLIFFRKKIACKFQFNTYLWGKKSSSVLRDARFPEIWAKCLYWTELETRAPWRGPSCHPSCVCSTRTPVLLTSMKGSLFSFSIQSAERRKWQNGDLSLKVVSEAMMEIVKGIQALLARLVGTASFSIKLRPKLYTYSGKTFDNHSALAFSAGKLGW